MAAVHCRLEWEGRIRPSSASLYALRSRSLAAVFLKCTACSWARVRLGISSKLIMSISFGSHDIPNPRRSIANPLSQLGRVAVEGSGSTVNVAAPKCTARDQLI